MTIKRLSITIFVMLLTLSIGLISTNLPLLIVNAQNSAISQDGNSNAEQKTKLSQSSNQNNQIVSGESSILSGNNILCSDQDNSNTKTSSNRFCESDGLINPIPNIHTNVLIVTASVGLSDRHFSAQITVTDNNDGSFDTFDVSEGQAETKGYVVPIKHNYTVKVTSTDIYDPNPTVNFDYSDCAVSPTNEISCSGIMDVNPQKVNAFITPPR